MKPGRIARTLASPVTALTVAAPLLAVGLLVASGRVPLGAVLGASSVRMWAAALVAVLATGAVVAALERRRAAALFSAAALCVAGQGILAVASHLDGVVELGVGEPPGAWSRVERGPLAALPVVQVLELPPAADGFGRVRMDGRDVSLRPGVKVGVGRVRVRIASIHPAVAVEVRRDRGLLLDAMLVKMSAGGRNEFGFERLPHRMTATFSAEPGVVTAVPARVDLKIRRGKLVVASQDVALGEPVAFEGLAVALFEGERWARIEVKSVTPVWPAGLGAALAVGAVAAAILERRRRGAA